MQKKFLVDTLTPCGAFALALTAERPPELDVSPLSPREYGALLKTLGILKNCPSPWETNMETGRIGQELLSVLNVMDADIPERVVKDIVSAASYGGVPDAAPRIEKLLSTWGDAFVAMRDRSILLSRSLTHGTAECETRVVALGDEGYPLRLAARLRENAPPFLCVAGDAGILNGASHAILGAETPKFDVRLKKAVQSTLERSSGQRTVVVSDGTDGVGLEAVSGALERGGRALVFVYGGLSPALQAQFGKRPDNDVPSVAFVSDRSFAELLPEAVYAVQPPTFARRPGAPYDEREARCLQLVLAAGEKASLIGVYAGDRVHAAVRSAEQTDCRTCGEVSYILSDAAAPIRDVRTSFHGRSGAGRIDIEDEGRSGAHCVIEFPTGTLSGPLPKVLSAVAAILGGASLEGPALGIIGSESEPQLSRRGGIKRNDRADLAELFRMGLSAFKECSPTAMDSMLPAGHVLNAYRDREDPYKILIVFLTNVLGFSPSGERGCYAARFSLEEPDWSERVEGVSAFSPRVLFLAGGKTMESWEKDEYGCCSDEPFTARELPAKIVAELLKAFYANKEIQTPDGPAMSESCETPAR